MWSRIKLVSYFILLDSQLIIRYVGRIIYDEQNFCDFRYE